MNRVTDTSSVCKNFDEPIMTSPEKEKRYSIALLFNEEM